MAPGFDFGIGMDAYTPIGPSIPPVAQRNPVIPNYQSEYGPVPTQAPVQGMVQRPGATGHSFMDRDMELAHAWSAVANIAAQRGLLVLKGK